MVTPPENLLLVSTTSLKLPDDVKQLAATAAQRLGVTPHAFMVDAIRVAATLAEKRAHFVMDALAAKTEMLASGRGHAAADVHAYLRKRAQGAVVAKPKAKSWRT